MKKLILITMAFCSLATFGQVVRPLSYTRIQQVTLDTINSNHVVANTAALGVISVTGITGGAWTGQVILGQYGGTGIANTGKTITVGGNFSTAAALAFSGAHAATFTLTAPTTVTFPITGTLATLAGSEALTNKTYNKITVTAPATSAGLILSDASQTTISGGDTTTIATTGNTSVTLPLTGTLSTLAGAEAFTNKTSFNKVKITAPTTSAEIVFSDASKTTISGGDTTTIATTANTSVTLPTAGKLMSESSADSVTGVKKFFGENIYYQAIQTVTDTVALSINGYQTVLADATGSAILITLPNAALCEGKVFEIKCINADAEVKIITAGGTIDATAGATGITMVLWESKRLISNGTNWYIL